LRAFYEIDASNLIRQSFFEVKNERPWSMIFFNKMTRLFIDACSSDIPWDVIDEVGFFAEIEEALRDAEVSMQPTVIQCLNALFAHIDDIPRFQSFESLRRAELIPIVMQTFSEEYLSVNSHLLSEYFTLALNLVRLFETREFASQILSSTVQTFRYHIKTFEWDAWPCEMWKLLHVCFRCEAASVNELLASVFDSILTQLIESPTDRLVRHTTSEFIDLIDAVCEFDEEKVKWLCSNDFPRVLVSLFRSPNKTFVASISSLLNKLIEVSVEAVPIDPLWLEKVVRDVPCYQCYAFQLASASFRKSQNQQVWVNYALTIQSDDSFEKKLFCVTCVSVWMPNLDFWSQLPGDVFVPICSDLLDTKTKHEKDKDPFLFLLLEYARKCINSVDHDLDQDLSLLLLNSVSSETLWLMKEDGCKMAEELWQSLKTLEERLQEDKEQLMENH
jgi:hypothetical protein